MKKPRTTKAAHIAFLAQLDRELLAMGAEKFIGHRPEEPCYRIATRHGSLELHGSVPIRLWDGQRVNYDLTIFGRFPDAARAAAELGHWKWNHHFGQRTVAEVAECIAYFCARLAFMLAPAETLAVA